MSIKSLKGSADKREMLSTNNQIEVKNRGKWIAISTITKLAEIICKSKIKAEDDYHLRLLRISR